MIQKISVNGLPRFAHSDEPVIARSKATKQSRKEIQFESWLCIHFNKSKKRYVIHRGNFQFSQTNMAEGFTRKYGLKALIYYEVFDDIESAITRENQLKAGNRKKKIALIETMNPNWNDLYESII